MPKGLTGSRPGMTYRLILLWRFKMHSTCAARRKKEKRKILQKNKTKEEKPASLDAIQKKIAFANIVPFIRDQVALRVNPSTKEASIEFYEFFLSVGDLQRAAAPDISFLADRWLFQDLSRTMDMLAACARYTADQSQFESRNDSNAGL